MPLLVYTTKLTNRAWNLAQLFDVRLLTIAELRHYDGLPPLTEHRPPYLKCRHRDDTRITDLRSPLPLLLRRRGLTEIEAPVFQGTPSGPCYVTDRTATKITFTATGPSSILIFTVNYHSSSAASILNCEIRM